MKLQIITEGAFQAWGVPSEFTYRGTNGEPTKRGIVGLIGCCMGIPRGDARLQHIYENLDFSCCVNTDSRGNFQAGSILTDFQTVSKPDGGRLNAANGGTGDSEGIILKKSYINDASFRVTLEGDDSLMSEIYDAMLDPVWVPYLGRKNCLPTEPLIPVLVE